MLLQSFNTCSHSWMPYQGHCVPEDKSWVESEITRKAPAIGPPRNYTIQKGSVKYFTNYLDMPMVDVLRI